VTKVMLGQLDLLEVEWEQKDPILKILLPPWKQFWERLCLDQMVCSTISEEGPKALRDQLDHLEHLDQQDQKDPQDLQDQ